ncbi:MAG: glycosyltransferase [Alphaproteobacteria bacterium]|nr:glycosyltransferase [Alphaproteobacteria bacterium]
MAIKKIGWIATAVTPYSETDATLASAGTNDFLRRMVDGLVELGVESKLLLPAGSDSRWPHVLFEGTLQGTLAEFKSAAQTAEATGSCLQGMVSWAERYQSEFDLIVNLGHDHLPISKIGQFRTPYVTLPNLCQTTPVIDVLIQDRAKQFPDKVWFFSKSQRAILGCPDNPVLRQPFDIAAFPAAKPYSQTSSAPLGWVGRIVPEKGLDSALEIAARMEKRLWVAGPIHNQGYFERLAEKFERQIDYRGCLSRDELYGQLAETEVFLQTQHPDWHEAFGRTTAEALLAGCPVLYYKSGANAELIELIGGGAELKRGGGGEREAYKFAVTLDRAAIQTRAQTIFDHRRIAQDFLQFAAIAQQSNPCAPSTPSRQEQPVS